jgi:hypothetical protein
MGRRIFSVPLEIALDALCRDDRKRVSDAPGCDPAWWQPFFVTCDGMPKDARVVGVLGDSAFNGLLELVIESEEWKPDPPGCALTRFDVQFTTYTSYQTYLEMAGKTERGQPADTPIYSACV